MTSHRRLAAKVSHGYRRYGLALNDINGEANLGLVIAGSRFEPDRGSRFSTHALWRIKTATTAQRKLFSEDAVATVARRLDVTRRDVIEMDRRLAGTHL